MEGGGKELRAIYLASTLTKTTGYMLQRVQVTGYKRLQVVTCITSAKEDIMDEN